MPSRSSAKPGTSKSLHEAFRSRELTKVITAHRAEEGSSGTVQQTLPSSNLETWDPILLLQENGPQEIRAGTPREPSLQTYRGFETLTYVLDGELEVWESDHHQSLISAGDLHWSSCASGTTRGEGPSRALQSQGGWIHALTFWVNLAQVEKTSSSRSTTLQNSSIPRVEIPGLDSVVRVLAGHYEGVQSPVQFTTPTILLDVEVAAGSEFSCKIEEGWNALVYVHKNAGYFGSKREKLIQQQMGLLNSSGDGLLIFNEAAAAPLRFILMAGAPLNEPVVRYGPFVMNSQEEIQRAFKESQGR
jgi:redox-sensitive bicupin YhaK (pirin superfamily)